MCGCVKCVVVAMLVCGCDWRWLPKGSMHVYCGYQGVSWCASVIDVVIGEHKSFI